MFVGRVSSLGRGNSSVWLIRQHSTQQALHLRSSSEVQIDVLRWSIFMQSFTHQPVQQSESLPTLRPEAAMQRWEVCEPAVGLSCCHWVHVFPLMASQRSLKLVSQARLETVTMACRDPCGALAAQAAGNGCGAGAGGPDEDRLRQQPLHADRHRLPRRPGGVLQVPLCFFIRTFSHCPFQPVTYMTDN